jgi:hypothetical protein
MFLSIKKTLFIILLGNLVTIFILSSKSRIPTVFIEKNKPEIIFKIFYKKIDDILEIKNKK